MTLIDEECGLMEFDDRGILTVVKVISTLLASLLVTAPIVVLYFVHSGKKRLEIVTGSTMLFSIAFAELSQLL